MGIRFSRNNLIIYIEGADYFGLGNQADVVWDQDRLVLESNSINEALHYLGIKFQSNLDEFDTLSLRAHRRTRSWSDF